MGFDVTTIPGYLFVTGDVGSLIVSREEDMIPWCRGSCKSTDYFAEKVKQPIRQEEFSWEAFREWVEWWEQENLPEKDEDDKEDAEQVREYKEILEKLHNALGIEGRIRDEDAPGWLYDNLGYNILEDSFQSWTIWEPGFLWCREAVRWFCENVDETITVTQSIDA